MFGSLFRDLERDPILGAHSRAMSRMMDSFFPGMDDFGFPGQQRSRSNGGDMMPFGMGMGMGGMFPSFPQFPMMNMNMNDFSAPPGGAAFSSTQVFSMQSGQNGQPVVYQASSTTRQGPGGVKEVVKTVTDSRSGVKKMQVGRHLGNKGHIMEREDNLYTGQREENEELLNMDFDEKEHFDREWRNVSNGRVRVTSAPAYEQPSITYGSEASSSRPYRSSSSNGRAITHTPTVTIEELSDDEVAEEAPRAPAATHIPTSFSRKPKDRKPKVHATRRSKKH